MSQNIDRTDEPDVFETTLQKTNSWVKEISDLLQWHDHHKAYHGLRAVLHALRDRSPLNEAVHLRRAAADAGTRILLRNFPGTIAYALAQHDNCFQSLRKIYG